MTIQSRIDRLRAACRLAIELGKKATDGPWVSQINYRLEGYSVDTKMQSDPHNVSYEIHMESDARFIAHARQFSPAAAKALLVAVDKMKEIYDADQLAIAEVRALYPNYIGTRMAEEALTAILDEAEGAMGLTATP